MLTWNAMLRAGSGLILLNNADDGRAGHGYRNSASGSERARTNDGRRRGGAL